MIAERIRCTEAELSAAYRIQGLRPNDGPTDALPGINAFSAESGLVDSDGSLTAIAQSVLPLLAQPERIITVSVVTVGQTNVDSAMILAPYGGGPFVFRGDRDGHIELVVVDSPTAAIALLDEMMAITALPAVGAAADVHIDRATWLGLLAAADAERASHLENQLARGTDPTPTFDAARLEHLINQALGAEDTRWILGAEALVDRVLVEEGTGSGREALSGLIRNGLAEPVGDAAQLTDAGRDWTEMLSLFVRLSQVRILHMIDGTPVDIVGMTFFRSPTDVVVAQISANDVTLMSLQADVAAATLRAALAGVAESDAAGPPTRTADEDSSPPAEIAAEWVYVLDPVEVRGLYDTAAVAGTLQPGTWYIMASSEGDWARVADADGSLVGWAPVVSLRRASHPPPAVDPAPSQASAPAWHADHVVPPDGAPVWAEPDPATAAAGSLAGGTGVRVVEVLGAWSRVQIESGADGWVDGRRLVDVAGQPPEPDGAPPAAAPAEAAPTFSVDAVVAAARSKPVQLIAAIALVISAFLPWFSDFVGSFDLPIAFLWSLEPDESSFSIGLLVLVVGVGALATVLFDRLSRYQRAAGGIATGIAAVWLIQTFRVVLDWEDGAFGTAVADMFTEVLSFGPWVALAAGIVLLVKR